jgi:hypothetical protein
MPRFVSLGHQHIAADPRRPTETNAESSNRNGPREKTGRHGDHMNPSGSDAWRRS